MDIMKDIPDKFFELAIVDPPYGIDIEQRVYKDKKKWDRRPTKKYFQQLFRISENQIIWGGNYMIDFLYPTKCFLIWDKKITDRHTFSMAEFAWTSYMSNAKVYYKPPPGERGFYKIDCKRIHPTQKPVELYKWILDNYAKEGDKIIDTHLGSGSSVIACIQRGFEYVGIELDKEYFEATQNRINQEKQQLKLFA